MKITVISVGKIKERYFREAVAEYEKRLSRYCRTQFIEVADEKTPDGASAAQEDRILEKEAERILRFIRPDACVMVLAIGGKSFSSVAFADLIEKTAVKGKSHIQFIIGGSLGLHSSVLAQADEMISFSDMTFPHQLMKVILCEQIYRAYRISSGEPYHK